MYQWQCHSFFGHVLLNTQLEIYHLQISGLYLDLYLTYQKYKNHCDSLYKKYIQTVALEKRIKEDSKSAKVAKKLEKIKADYSDTILLKKLRNKKWKH